jgi:hypothetical protein
MKLLLSLFLSLQIVTNFTFFEDVVRIPFLIEHYRHHTEKETPNISFIDFIAMHYFNDNNHQDASHNTLPLNHSSDIGHVHLSPAYTLPEALKIFTQIPLEIEHFTFIKQFIPNHNLDSIFQPPKTIC